ncbi:MAG: AMP-binding protein [Phycisphaerae bacterium]|nr:AMP-binding protein [Tepidisphaeraceae bacterium]
MQAPALFNFARDVVEGWAKRTPDATALWWIADPSKGAAPERKFTFAQIAGEARRAAAAFATAGIAPGDRVLVILPRIPQWWTAMLGLIRLGAVPIPGTPLLTPKDVAYRVQAASAKALLTDAEGAARYADLDAPGIRLVTGGGTAPVRWKDFDVACAAESDAFDPPHTPSDSPGFLYFTSGTTGMPKMVLHTQASYGLGHKLTGEQWLSSRPGDVVWNLSDTGWAKAAWSSFFGPWHTGSCIFTVDARGKFDPAAALDVLATYPIHVWCAPPTALRLIVREDLSRRKFPHLRRCVSAGEPLNPEVISLWQSATALPIFEGYGQTESVCMCGASPSMTGGEIRPGSMGKPMPGFDLAILDADNRELPAGRDGQLAVRVKPNRPLGLFREYWLNPGENAARFVGDYYLTGDVARRDEDGWLWFVGRADDVIKSSGYRIGPFEVESALVEHPSVVEAAVVGKPDEVRGQIVKAFVVLSKDLAHFLTDAARLNDLAAELQAHCKRTTAPYKYPREIEFVAELPKTVSGKIRRVELRGR